MNDGLLIRDATAADVPQMSAFLEELRRLGKRISSADEAFVMRNYIVDADKIKCSVAEVEGRVKGFQSLKLAREGNMYGVAPGWGIIGTHIDPTVARLGLGRALFKSSLAAAQGAGLKNIDASIGANNPEGLAYYEAMGFSTYREPNGLICKRLQL